MKNGLFTIVIFTMISNVCFAQNVVRQDSVQTTEKTMVYANREVKPSGRFSLATMKTLDPMLYSQYQSGKKMQVTGIILTGVGGGVTMLGALFSILPDADRGEITIGGSVIETDGNNEDLRKAGPVLMIAGAACLSAGIPIMVVGVKKKKQARRDFMGQYYSPRQASSFLQMNVYPNSVGIAYVF